MLWNFAARNVIGSWIGHRRFQPLKQSIYWEYHAWSSLENYCVGCCCLDYGFHLLFVDVTARWDYSYWSKRKIPKSSNEARSCLFWTKQCRIYAIRYWLILYSGQQRYRWKLRWFDCVRGNFSRRNRYIFL